MEITEVLDKAIELRREFKKLYDATGIISVESYSGIHVTEEFLLSMPSRMSGPVERIGCKPYTQEYFKEYKGIKVFTITDNENLGG